MNYKKFIPCIYLYKGMAVTDFDDRTPVNMNPAELAKYYSDNHADEIIIFDLSKGDLEHEEALGMIKHIVNVVEIPVIGAGNVHRMEDIKKILYTGCIKAVLNFSKESNIELLEEVSNKFGRDKIIVAINEKKIVDANKDNIERYASEILAMNVVAMKGEITSHTFNDICLPVIGMIATVSLDKMIEILSLEGISGISGGVVNENAKEILAIKSICLEKGLAVNSYENAMKWSDLTLNSDNMIPVVVQDYQTAEVLMVAYMDEEAYYNTLKTGKMTYYSRSRNEQWVKGETSGHYQFVKALYADCDMDTILAKVSQIGVACHTGAKSCFYNQIIKKDYDETNPLKVFEEVLSVIKDRKINPKEGSYTNYLFDKGVDKILKKMGEEATEIVIAAKNPNPEEIKYEISDFLYHMMVLMVEKGISWEEIMTELANR